MLLIDPLFKVTLHLLLGLVLVTFAGQVTFSQSKRPNFMLHCYIATYINQVEIFILCTVCGSLSRILKH